MSRTHRPRKMNSHQYQNFWRDRVTTREREADALRRALDDGLVEYDDTALHYGEPLDYVATAALHVMRAREDRRHLGRRASDRRRWWVRPPKTVDTWVQRLGAG